ncbi:MAG: hypothetical protein JO002_02095 [Burkholderiaceae bacterium]|nr:hypothetical protein [Burkholderiaceae bacterium]
MNKTLLVTTSAISVIGIGNANLMACPMHGDTAFKEAKNFKSTQTTGAKMINKPETLLQLLSNIKALSDDNAFSRIEYYTDESLTSTLGGERVVWRQDTDKWKMGWLEGFEKIVESHALPNGNVFPGIQLHFLFDARGDVAKYRIDLRLAKNAHVTFETAEELFGKDWVLDEDAVLSRAMTPTRNFFSPTHPMGNTPIIYSPEAAGKGKQIAIEFNEHGEVQTVRVSGEVK